MTQTVPARSEVPKQYTWNTESIFPTDDAWEAEFTAVAESLPALTQFRGRLSEGPSVLADYVEASEDVTRRLGKVFVYASMGASVDTGDQAAQARSDRARGLMARYGAATAFAEPELLQIGFDTLRQWLQTEPRLAHYGHYLDRLERRQAHVRSAEVEEVLSQAMDPMRTASATHGLLANADLRFPPARSRQGEEFEVTQGTINALLSHADREVRRTAWEGYADAHLATKNTMANALATGIKQDVFIMRARRYTSSLDAALEPNHIPTAVFHNLIAVFKANLPTWHRYWRLRARAMGTDKLRVYDARAPLSEHKTEVPFEQAVDWIGEGMQPLGEEYVDILRRGVLEQRWVDVYPNQGKRMGAFSTGVFGTYPFIFMSFNNDLFSMSTLAHELGHSLHSYYAWQTQPLVYSRYGLFVAEVASNFNQAMVRAHLLHSNPDRDFQIGLIEEAMANFHRYFFVMPTLARLELEIHERVERGQALTADYLINRMADLFSEGYGGDVNVDRDRVGITWAQFHTHLYSNFYVYQYATGISGAHALAQRILDGVPGAADAYLQFLKAGGSVYPLDALQQAGVDLASPEPVESTFAVLASYVDRLEQLV
ncbi:MAG: oligoendopeptidase F [Anaerolineae bacterium]|nr:oligoendopeptidase F [Anaerolineae bacterium]